MIEIVGLVVGLLCLQLILVLRQLASISVPQWRWRAAPVASAPRPYADLFEQDERALAALGFEPQAWMLLEDASGRGPATLLRTFVDRTTGTTASLQPPIDLTRPNHLVATFSSLLEDGRSLSSFRYSVVDEFFDTARSRRRSFAVDGLDALYRAHSAWRDADPVERAPDDADADTATIAAASTARFEALVADLETRGVLRRDREGRLRLRLLAMLRLYLRLLRASKQRPDATPVELGRQLALFALFERGRERAPTPTMQFGLLAATTALFALLGGALWGAATAMLIAGVLVLHEAGHYLAMRALGYRHVQMVLLPLLGGVTTGVETDPRGSHRALVSLMGPLPGIVLGWLLLVAITHAGAPGSLTFAAALLLVLNYLNLLPIPPLDGGHFVQSLLPRGWERLEAAVVACLALAGIALAVALHWWLLLALVGLQLFALRNHWRDARLLRGLRADAGFGARAGRALDERLLAAIDADTPHAKLAQRFVRVLRLRTLLALRPPQPRTRAWLVTIYVAAFALPFASPAVRDLAATLVRTRATPTVVDSAAEARYRAYAARRDAQQLASSRLATPALLDGIAASTRELDATRSPSTATEVPPIPTDDAFEAAAQRLGVALPADFRDLAHAPQRTQLAWREPVALVSAGELAAEWLDAMSGNGTTPVQLSDADGGEHAVSRAQLARAMVIAGSADDGWVLYDTAGAACCRVIEFLDEGATAYPDLHAWLVERHVEAAMEVARQRTVAAARERVLAESAASDLRTLVDGFAALQLGTPRWRDVDATTPSPAAVDDTVRRVGTLPDDYRAVVALRDGLAAATLLPLAEVTTLDDAQLARIIAGADWVRIGDDGIVRGRFGAGEAASTAALIGAWRGSGLRDAASRATIVLVRSTDGAPIYLDVASRRAHESLRRLLLERYADLRAQEAG